MDLNQFSTVDIVLDKANDNIIQRQTISAGDRDGRSLTLQVTDAGSIGEVPGLTANLLWTNHSSGVSDLSAFSVVDRTKSVFKINYPQNMLTAGKVTAQIQLLYDGKATHSKKFEIIVLDIAGKLKGVLQRAEYTALVEALAKTNGFETEIAKKADKTQVDALGSEINVARGEAYTTLGDRLDSEKAEVSAQLEQNKNGIVDLTNYTDSQIGGLNSKIGALGASSTFKGSDTRTNINAKTGMSIGDEWFDTTNNISIRWNGTSWVDVGSAIKVGNGSITPEKTTMFDIGKNLFNKFAVRKGGYTQYTDGIFVPVSGYNTSIFKINPNTEYHQTTNEQYALFDANLNSIGGRPGGAEDWNITTPSNAHFIGVNVKDQFLDTYQLEKGNSATAYENFRYILKKKYLSSDQNVYTVNKTSGDFGTVKEAITGLLSKGSSTNIDISIGEYDEIVNEIRGLSKLSLVGKNKRSTKIIDKSGDYYNSPLQIVGDFLVKNLSIIANHDNVSTLPTLTSYAYHGDYFGEGTSRFEDVIFESYQNSAVGIGTHNNQTMMFKDCDIYTDTLYGAALYMHCSTQSTEINQKIAFDNCRILSKKGDALRIEDANILYGDGAGTDLEVEFINCHIWSEEKGLDCYSVAPAPIGVGTLAGNVKLSPKSHGNNLAVLNAY